MRKTSAVCPLADEPTKGEFERAMLDAGNYICSVAEEGEWVWMEVQDETGRRLYHRTAGASNFPLTVPHVLPE